MLFHHSGQKETTQFHPLQIRVHGLHSSQSPLLILDRKVMIIKKIFKTFFSFYSGHLKKGNYR